MKTFNKKRAGFSLIEVLAAVAIIGIITFLALPNVIEIRERTEENMAIARAEAINIGISNYIQANGFVNAKTSWDAQTGSATEAAEKRYDLITPYLSFAPNRLLPDAGSGAVGFMPVGYTVAMPGTLVRPMSKVALSGPSGSISY